VAWLSGATAARSTGARPGAARGAAGQARAATARSAAGWGLAGLLAAAFAVNGALMVHKIETMPFGHPELRAEPIVDRARIASNVRAGVVNAPLPAGATLLFYSPEARAMAPAADPGAETYWERNVRGALYDGVAVRLFAPRVREVRFVTAPVPGDSIWYALYDITGRTQVVRADTLR
jgi:hypothetical protein